MHHGEKSSGPFQSCYLLTRDSQFSFGSARSSVVLLDDGVFFLSAVLRLVEASPQEAEAYYS